ncbi:sigma 54-interacting transcriptional regulator [Halocella sp. SP3-1]|uniref:sigma-54 interaction domain-containing protein n=1 Tax=Halocella sp. SP3-1 TaxID=2382161 RepID=UPI000F75698D|nr:sigma 54-interacting transcriptional regulator [Halocella sp. SP3-1]AZO95953.1 PAS domain S-box protein [Halocella sp. SP3-1]
MIQFDDKNLRFILNSLDEGIHIVNQEGYTIFYNRKVSEIDGLDPEEVLGKNVFETYPSLTLETSTLMKTLKEKKGISNYQQTFINCRGKKITTINSTIPLNFENGETGAMEVSRDITQLKELVNNINALRTDIIKKRQKKKSISQKSSNSTSYSFKDIVGKSKTIQKALQMAIKAADSDSSVLLAGETGTGKELFAQGIHTASRRNSRPFIAQNCAALPKDLLEGLLFGTEKGGFTGARSRTGLFEDADGGSILLDEINAMDPALQAKLLRVLQEKKVRRIGGQKEIDIDVRIIATINESAEKTLKENKLREDLFYRLSVVYIEIPPLREREGDIQLLTEHFINKYNKKFSRSIKGITVEMGKVFNNYNWPGNVRELQHVIESSFNILQNANKLGVNAIPQYIKGRMEKKANLKDDLGLLISGNKVPPLEETLENIEANLIQMALKRTAGNISAAARELKISRQSLQYKIKKYDLTIVHR